MKANKIILNGDTLIDLTEDTVTETDVVEGKTFHKSNGEHSTVREQNTKAIQVFCSDGTVDLV